ncbi:MAG: hypothetical protein WAT16_15000 [Saprospiraceae bacterium]
MAIRGIKRSSPSNDMPAKILRQDPKSKDVCVVRWNPVYQLEGLVI